MSLKVSCSTLVEVDSRILLVGERHGDDLLFTLPGGTLEKGEGFLECLARKTKEETGLAVEVLGMVDRYDSLRTNAKNSIARLVFAAEPVGGVLAISDKHPVVGFYDPEELDYLQVQDQIKRNATLQAIDDYRVRGLLPRDSIVPILKKKQQGHKMPKRLAS